MNSMGNWSEALTYNTTVEPSTPGSPDPPNSGSSGVPPWVFGVIGAAVLLLTVIALVVVVIFIANRRYCFHWFSKVSPPLVYTEATNIGLPVSICTCFRPMGFSMTGRRASCPSFTRTTYQVDTRRTQAAGKNNVLICYSGTSE